MLKAKNDKLKKVIKLFNKYTYPWLYEIAEHDSFDQSNVLPSEISEHLREMLIAKEVELVFYKPKWRLSNALAYFSPYYKVWYKPWRKYKTKTLTVRFNSIVFDKLSNCEKAGVLAHELVHVSDYLNEGHYGHNGNRKKGNEKTAPYLGGSIMKDICKLNEEKKA